jgi:hypothetical protein
MKINFVGTTVGYPTKNASGESLASLVVVRDDFSTTVTNNMTKNHAVYLASVLAKKNGLILVSCGDGFYNYGLPKTDYKTVIYCESGYYASKLLWRDASYAFQNRNTPLYGYTSLSGYRKTESNAKYWQNIGVNSKNVADLLGIDEDMLPKYDNEFITIGEI